MVDYEYADLFTKDRTDKQLSIVSDDGLINITNTEIRQQQFELTESLCSESELRFGCCEKSMVKFTIDNVYIAMTGKWLTITMTVEGHLDKPFQIGRYKVFSDTVSADRTKRDIVAYDAMHDILNTDMAVWYNEVLPNKDSTMTLKEFRTRFINHFGLWQVVPQEGLVNDNMIVEKTIEPEQISGKDIITAICEINGCFGHVGRDGKFHYIYLQQDIMGLYPANFLYPDHVPEEWDYLPQAKTWHLYPQDPKGIAIGKSFYITAQYEDYIVRTIDKIQIRKEENDIGAIYPEEQMDNPNSYIIEDNFLAYKDNKDELKEIAKNIFGKINDVIYRPFEADCKGNPCFEVGDAVRIPTKYHIIETYILRRTLKGVQALRDLYASDGVERYTEKVNGIHRSIVQLKGKSNVLERNIEETKSELRDTAKELSTRITQNSESIKLEAERAIDAEGKLKSSIEVLADKIVLKVNSNGDIALVQLSADPNSGTTFKVKAGNLQLTAEEAINLMAGGNLNLSGKNIVINSNNFSVSSDGTVRCYKIVEFGVEGNARNSFDGYVSANSSVIGAQNSANAAQSAADAAYRHADDRYNQLIEQLNNNVYNAINQQNIWIKQLSGQLQALGQPGIS